MQITLIHNNEELLALPSNSIIVDEDVTYIIFHSLVNGDHILSIANGSGETNRIPFEALDPSITFETPLTRIR